MLLHQRMGSLAIAAAILLSGCIGEPPPDNAIARVGDRFVSSDDYKKYLERSAGLELGQLSSEAASAILDQYLEEVLLAEYALSVGENVPAERITAEVRISEGSSPIEIRDQLLRDALLAGVAGSMEMPDRADIEQYYEDHPEEFLVEDRVHVRQILLKTQKEAEDALRRLRQGEDFSELAKEVSVAPTAERGGDIGVVARGDLPKAVEEAVFEIEPGDYSGVVETAGSFHIFQVLDHLEAGTIELERAVPLIESRLEGDEISRKMAELTSEARRTIESLVFTNRIAFEYSGTFPTSTAE